MALFGPSIPEVVNQCKVAFDTHFGSINVVYFDEHGTPLRQSPDCTPHFLHALQAWFKYFSGKNKTPTLKIETAQGKGFVIALHNIIHHKVQKDWFKLYMETESWKNQSGEYWKDGKKFNITEDGKLLITSNVGLMNESSIKVNAPQDELQVKVLLELIR